MTNKCDLAAAKAIPAEALSTPHQRYPGCSAPFRTNTIPAVAAAKANCTALIHPIVASNRSTPPGSRGIDYPGYSMLFYINNGLHASLNLHTSNARECQSMLNCRTKIAIFPMTSLLSGIQCQFFFNVFSCLTKRNELK
jgi:hypothetical protein